MKLIAWSHRKRKCLYQAFTCNKNSHCILSTCLAYPYGMGRQVPRKDCVFSEVWIRRGTSRGKWRCLEDQRSLVRPPASRGCPLHKTRKCLRPVSHSLYTCKDDKRPAVWKLLPIVRVLGRRIHQLLHHPPHVAKRYSGMWLQDSLIPASHPCSTTRNKLTE